MKEGCLSDDQAQGGHIATILVVALLKFAPGLSDPQLCWRMARGWGLSVCTAPRRPGPDPTKYRRIRRLLSACILEQRAIANGSDKDPVPAGGLAQPGRGLAH